ncbi:hypothetical protein GCM10007276_34440 [Agaricicola taiwanensis]|uniref:Ankyrin repeat domain-containing protein n=1 Tax=Agaricicola taiwanensis TaxID=591372 RepID=A0A8J2YMX0_9RHOB|nr:hypothetical protein GCM10007276_34440 [Agaricicola taiwanensis]
MEAVKAFLANLPEGFDFNTRRSAGNSPIPLLHLAIEFSTLKNNNILKLLLEDPRIDLTTLPPDSVTARGMRLPSALDYARSVDAQRRTPTSAETVKLIEQAMNRALQKAIAKGDDKAAIALIKAGAEGSWDITGLRDQGAGVSILHYAIAFERKDVVEAILEATPEKDRDALIETALAGQNNALHVAAVTGQTDILEILRRRTDGSLRPLDDPAMKNEAGLTPADLVAHHKKRGLEVGIGALADLGLIAGGVATGLAIGIGFAVLAYLLYKHLNQPPEDAPLAVSSPSETGGSLGPYTTPAPTTGHPPRPSAPPPGTIPWTPTVSTAQPSPTVGRTYFLPPELWGMVVEGLWGDDPYETFHTLRNFMIADPEFAAYITAQPSVNRRYNELSQAVNSATRVWNEAFPMGSTALPYETLVNYLITTYRFVNPARRIEFVNAMLDAGSPYAQQHLTTLFELWPVLSGDQQNRLIDAVLNLADDPNAMDILLPRVVSVIGDLDERPEGQRSPSDHHDPDSRLSRIFDLVEDHWSIDTISFEHLDEDQQSVATAFLRDDGNFRQLGQNLRYLSDERQQSMIGALLNYLRADDNASRTAGTLGLAGALPLVGFEEQEEILESIVDIDDPLSRRSAMEAAWPLLASLPEDARAGWAHRLVEVALADDLPDRPADRLSALSVIARDMGLASANDRARVFDAILGAVDQEYPALEFEDLEALNSGYLLALASFIIGARHLDDAQRRRLMDELTALNDEDLMVVLDGGGASLGELSREERGLLQQRVSRFANERVRSAAFATLLGHEFVPPSSNLHPRQSDADTSAPPPLTDPAATEEVYEDGLNTLALRIFKSMDFHNSTMLPLTDQTLAPLFINLVIYALNHNGLKLTPGQNVDEKVMYEAFDKVITALRSRVWNEANKYGDKANDAAAIFSAYWDADMPGQGRGSDQIDGLVRQAWERWLESNKVESLPDASSPDATPQDYEDVLNTLVVRMVDGMDFSAKTMARLNDSRLEGLFRSLIVYELNRSDPKAQDQVGLKWKVFGKVLKAIEARLPHVLRHDPQKAAEATDIWRNDWRNGGADDADEVVDKAFYDWLEDKGIPMEAPDDVNSEVAAAIGEGYRLISTRFQYIRDLVDDPGVMTMFSNEGAYEGKAIRITQVDTSNGKIVGKFVVDIEGLTFDDASAAWQGSSAGAQALWDRRSIAAQEERGLYLVLRDVFHGYDDPATAPIIPILNLSPALRRAHLDWLAQQFRKPDFDQEGFIAELKHRQFTKKQIRQMVDSGFFEPYPDLLAELKKMLGSGA